MLDWLVCDLQPRVANQPEAVIEFAKYLLQSRLSLEVYRKTYSKADIQLLDVSFPQ